jgi:hypothetical protein
VEDERQRAKTITPANVLPGARIVGGSVDCFDDAGVPADDLIGNAESPPDTFRIGGDLDGFLEPSHAATALYIPEIR